MSDNGYPLALDRIKAALGDIGYTGGLLQEQYAFADYLALMDGVGKETIPVAAFTQDPPSYRDAAIGVVVANGSRGADHVRGFRSLGAPLIFEIVDDNVVRWKITGKGQPIELESVDVERIPGLFEANKESWSPQSVRSARTGQTLGAQLDFFDSDFLPLLDHEIRTKLDGLLKETVERSSAQCQPLEDDDQPLLYRMIFRLLTAKVIADSPETDIATIPDPISALEIAEGFYGEEDFLRKPLLDNIAAQEAAWEVISSRLHFQNLSVDSLAYVYENTFVSRKTRQIYGTHATPREVAEYIVNQLPFEDLAQDERRVFEPFSGHSVFLVAAMQRLRNLLPNEMGPAEKHRYFQSMLCGMEIDDFALEVAKLSLMLADYPNKDGWRLIQDDVFTSPSIDQELDQANIVLCNPPFERFSPDDRSKYENLRRPGKPLKLLEMVLRRPPRQLGLVLPRPFLSGPTYRDFRGEIARNYSSIEVVEMPDQMFSHSKVQTVMFMGSGRKANTVRLRSGRVKDKREFVSTRSVGPVYEEHISDPHGALSESIGLVRLREVWKATEHLNRLSDMAKIRRGVQKIETAGSPDDDLKSAALPRMPIEKSPTVVIKKSVLEPFLLSGEEEELVIPEMAPHVAWREPKVAVNKYRRGGSWVMNAAIDWEGSTLWTDAYGVWCNNDIPLEVLAAVLNGPVANAFVSVRDDKRDIRWSTLKRVPMPDCGERQQEDIVGLVRQYTDVRRKWENGAMSYQAAHDLCRDLLMQIDAQVLLAYDLPVRIEHDLVNFFYDQKRPGPVEFTDYIPIGFVPHFPLHMHVSGDIEWASAAKTRERIQTIPGSPEIDEMLSNVD